MFFGWWEILNKEFIIFIPITFLLDIFKELITGYYDKGIIIKDHQKIAIKYAKTYLIFDFKEYFERPKEVVMPHPLIYNNGQRPSMA